MHAVVMIKVTIEIARMACDIGPPFMIDCGRKVVACTLHRVCSRCSIAFRRLSSEMLAAPTAEISECGSITFI